MDQQTRTLIELRNVDLHYDRRSILKNLTFSIKAGEFVLIYGSTGTGKSTLCRLLAGLIRPNDGQLFLAGDRIDLLNEGSTSLVATLHGIDDPRAFSTS